MALPPVALDVTARLGPCRAPNCGTTDIARWTARACCDWKYLARSVDPHSTSPVLVFRLRW